MLLQMCCIAFIWFLSLSLFTVCLCVYSIDLHGVVVPKPYMDGQDGTLDRMDTPHGLLLQVRLRCYFSWIIKVIMGVGVGVRAWLELVGEGLQARRHRRLQRPRRSFPVCPLAFCRLLPFWLSLLLPFWRSRLVPVKGGWEGITIRYCNLHTFTSCHVHTLP
jgi:hypothetical protein